MTTNSRQSVALIVLASALTACATVSNEERVPMDNSDLPLVCTLSADQMESARAGLIPGLLARADEIADLENGLCIRFTTRPGLLTDLAQMMEQERGCCRFLRFQLTAEAAAGTVSLDITGPPGTREMLRAL